MTSILHEGDCLEILKTLDADSIDAVVTDPPYELGFMGKKWDATGIANNPALWSEVIRVLKPGGHVAAFSGTRTYHRMACAIEDAGFEIRDQLAWVYGTGFPKSHSVSLAIDKINGAPHRAKSFNTKGSGDRADEFAENGREFPPPYEPATDAARQWQGWGTALKPAWEPICLARKPLSEKTVAANVLRWGAGAINVDGCRVGTEVLPEMRAGQAKLGTFERHGMVTPERVGRWPANLCHDGSQEVLEIFPDSKGQLRATGPEFERKASVYGKFAGVTAHEPRGDSGSAARFFYSAKASKADRNGSKHPTVKPVALMQWLCRMLTPPGGVVLDPFAGSGTTGEAAIREGFKPVLIEREAEYHADIRCRLQKIAAE